MYRATNNQFRKKVIEINQERNVWRKCIFEANKIARKIEFSLDWAILRGLFKLHLGTSTMLQIVQTAFISGGGNWSPEAKIGHEMIRQALMIKSISQMNHI